MHCEILLPALLSAPAGARLAAIELLLARGRGSAEAALSPERWLLESFEVEQEPLPLGALTVLGGGGDAGDALWARADPVHLQLMRDRLILVPGAAFALSAQEAAALIATLNAHFEDELEFLAVRPGEWCVRLKRDIDLQAAASPLETAGRDAELGRLRETGCAATLMNEVQMLLHEHPVNEAREARGELPVNSVWLWGPGRAPGALSCHWTSVTADDSAALGLARLAGVRHRRLPASAQAWLERAPEEGRHLVVIDALRAPAALSQSGAFREALEALDRDWFAPLLAALRTGRVGMVTLHVPDAAESLSFETIRGDLRRFWRRTKALERYA